MNNKTEHFLDEVCTHIKCKSAHNDIKDELNGHIDDLIQSNLSKGMDKNNAIAAAVASMGSSDEIGEKLNKQHKPQTEWSIVLLTLIISAFGAVIAYISSNFNNSFISMTKYVFYFVVGIGIVLGAYYFDYTKLKKLAKPIYITGILMLAATYFFGVSVNGARRWLRIGAISISSANLASVLFITAYAGFLVKYKNQGVWGIAKLLGIAFISLIPVAQQPNLSVAFIMLITYTVVLFTAISKNHFGGNKKAQLVSLSGLGVFFAISGILSAVLRSPYRLGRVLTFLSRGQNDPAGEGWQRIMADKWLAASNIFGKAGFINEGAPDMTLPGVTNEYILVNIIASIGWIAGIALILTVAAFVIRLFCTSSKIKSSFGKYLSLSACTLLSAQFIISILINFGLLPFVGMDMPFVSYTGSNYAVSMLLVGIVLSVWRRNKLISCDDNAAAAATSKKRIKFSDGKLVIDFSTEKQQY